MVPSLADLSSRRTPARTGSDPELGLSSAVAAGLEAALKARAPGVHALTPMVRQLAAQVCRSLGLDKRNQALVDVCARVRDVGMIALPDGVVLATGSLSPGDWELVNRHPVIGAELLGTLAEMEAIVPIVRSHHERWDGGGYPDGRRGEEIPLLSRVIAVCDAFVAMARDRPHRRGVGVEAALEHLEQESGRQFDPFVVGPLINVVAGGNNARAGSPHASRQTPVSQPRRRAPTGRGGAGDLKSVIDRFDVVPAFGPAVERVLSATASDADLPFPGDLVAAIESDTGLTIAVLRAAQGVSGRRRIMNIVDAVGALTLDQIREALIGLPRAAFPWRTPLEALMHELRVHAQAVSRAAERIVRELQLQNGDDLLVAALLHDVGKLVLSRTRVELESATDRSTTPEQRVQRERQLMGLDHASVGGLLLSRWGLPAALSQTVAAHHSSEAGDEPATLVRMADMIAHHAHGDAVDRGLMLRLAQTCGLSLTTLRDALFDLPHAGGSQRRRAEPSPLSARETVVLRRLAEGKMYKQIGTELGLASSTVRTHLHNIYRKLNVADRAQAVLLATEMAWI